MRKSKKQRTTPGKTVLGLKSERKTSYSLLSSIFEEICKRNFLITANQNSGINKSGKKAKIIDKKRLGNGSIPKR